ncbi:hypothetical protein CEE37_07770 [candidate division LCP-89 bacterium B3_LCP]|uniref:Glycosyltransferase RgtA/B/C/D-like domain-containing protein n=1 Tax=candidate division LCP-89 bacterium B3_LCP TaxID=2012998 RepID=A0A532V0W3_UNCL8|nr:MAG: hypothetical protein CEE37_07770 [candidate division LCP-89 bacterium B3_LCP]
MSESLHLVLLLIVLLLGGLFLFTDLDRYDYWGDESLTFPKGETFADVLKYSKLVPSQVHPPLYNFLQFTWNKLFPRSDISANRFLYALFGFVSIGLVYLLGKELFSKKIGLAASLLVATSPYFIEYSRMVRYYPLTAMLALLTIYTFVRYQKSGRWVDWSWFTISGVFLIYEDYLGWTVLLVLYLYLFINWKVNKERLIRWLLAALVMFALFSPWVPVLLSQIGRESNPYPELAQQAIEQAPRLAQKGVGLRSMIFNDVMKIGYLGNVFTIGETTYPWRWVVTVPVYLSFLLLFIIALVRSRNPAEKNARFMIFITLFALVILIILSDIYGVFSSRMFQFPTKAMFLLPLFLLLMVKSWDYLQKTSAQLVVGVILIGGNLYGVNNYFSGQQFLNPKFLVPWRQITGDLEKIAQPEDLILNDEEAFIYTPIVGEKKVEKFGLVDALEKVEKTFHERGPMNVFLTIRYRGDEQITMEGLKVLAKLEDRYPLVDKLCYTPTDREAVPYWKRFLGRELKPHLLEVYQFRVEKAYESETEPVME